MDITWEVQDPSNVTLTLGSFYAQPNITGDVNVTGVKGNSGKADTIMTVTPAGFHFHIMSEHTFEGRYSVLETHLVTSVVSTEPGTPCQESDKCLAVFGVLYDFSEDATVNNTFLAPYLSALETLAPGKNVTLPNSTLNLADYFPTNNTSFVRYSGSLTTPPCTEDVLWTVFTETRGISFAQFRTVSRALDSAVLLGLVPRSTDNRFPQLRNDRPLWHYDSRA